MNLIILISSLLIQGAFCMENSKISELKKLGADVETDPKYPQVISYKMKNGLKILMLEKKFAPTVSFTMMFKVGNVDNVQGQTGLAHLFEHMAFKGTKKIGTRNYSKEKEILDKIDELETEINNEDKKANKDTEKINKLKEEVKKLEAEAEKYQVREEFWKIYNELGQNGMNAFTSTDYTGYIVSLPSDRTEAYFIIESDRFKNPVLRDFYKERSVVLEELRMNKSDPSRVSWENLLSHAFVAHPYHNPTIGWEDDVSHLTRKQAEDFYKKFYLPNNATLAVVGDIDPIKIIKLSEKYFSDWKPAKLPDTNYTKEPQQNAEKIIKEKIKENNVYVIGDTEKDITAAKNLGYHSACVLDGFGDKKKIFQSGPELLEKDFSNMRVWLIWLGLKKNPKGVKRGSYICPDTPIEHAYYGMTGMGSWAELKEIVSEFRKKKGR
jgi:predicted Zn-dependent peptidase